MCTSTTRSVFSQENKFEELTAVIWNTTCPQVRHEAVGLLAQVVAHLQILPDSLPETIQRSQQDIVDRLIPLSPQLIRAVVKVSQLKLRNVSNRNCGFCFR